MRTPLLVVFILFVTLSVQAELVVCIDEPKPAGDKSLIRITLKNTFKQKVESARATLFLLDDKNKIVGQTTAWVVGGAKDKPVLLPDGKNTYNFLIRPEKPFTTIRLTFSRIVLEGGKLADPVKDFVLEK